MSKYASGWYFVELYQFNKEKDEHPDYFNDWIEMVGDNWDLGEYESRCKISKVIRPEQLKEVKSNE
jgi:hypothetical protein